MTMPVYCGETVRVLRGKEAGMIAMVVRQEDEQCSLLEMHGGDSCFFIGEIEFEYSAADLVQATPEEIASYTWRFTLTNAEVCKVKGHNWRVFSSLYDENHTEVCMRCELMRPGPPITAEERARVQVEIAVAQARMRALTGYDFSYSRGEG